VLCSQRSWQRPHRWSRIGVSFLALEESMLAHTSCEMRVSLCNCAIFVTSSSKSKMVQTEPSSGGWSAGIFDWGYTAINWTYLFMMIPCGSTLWGPWNWIWPVSDFNYSDSGRPKRPRAVGQDKLACVAILVNTWWHQEQVALHKMATLLVDGASDPRCEFSGASSPTGVLIWKI
jgi:hypothetical protein